MQSDLAPNAGRVARAIAKHGEIVISPVTGSMRPLIREQRDCAVLGKPRFPLKKYDVALYERQNGLLVMHRVIGFDENGPVFSADNRVQRETGIRDDRVCAVMTGFFHKEKYIRVDNALYRLYCRAWCGNIALRRAAEAVWRLIKKLKGTKKAPG